MIRKGMKIITLSGGKQLLPSTNHHPPSATSVLVRQTSLLPIFHPSDMHVHSTGTGTGKAMCAYTKGWSYDCWLSMPCRVDRLSGCCPVLTPSTTPSSHPD